MLATRRIVAVAVYIFAESTNAVFKKTIIVLMLALTPLAQARAVFVCSMMNALLLDRCCCEHAGRVPMPREDPSASCCAVTVELTPDRSVATASVAPASDRQQLARPSPLTPDVAIAPRAPLEAAVVVSALPVHASSGSFAPSGSLLYLLTARLRL